MVIEIVGPVLGASIQDLGRPGHYSVGIPPGGALDLASALAANLLVGNNDAAPVLEAPYLGPAMRILDDAVMAVTGAAMELRINGHPAPQWESIAVAAGDEVSFGILQAGARVYVAMAGGFDVPSVLGSRSTYVPGGFGGFEGRALRVGDRIAVLPPSRPAIPGRRVPTELRPALAREVDVRVVLGLYDYRLTGEGVSRLLDTAWTLTPVADRMGFRYQGAELVWEDRIPPFGAGSDPSNIVDAGYPVGSIQVPGGTEPIVLHRDAPSGGGYAMVATVISADMNMVGQCAPGTTTRFRQVSLEQALSARHETAEHGRRLRSALQD